MVMIGIVLAIASTTSAVEKTGDIRTFGELPVGAEAGAMLQDFCGGINGIALPSSRQVSPLPSAEVVVAKTSDGVYASVILRKDETSTRSAVFAMDRLIVRVGQPCDNALDAMPVVSIGAEGLRIIQDKDGNPGFHLEGATK